MWSGDDFSLADLQQLSGLFLLLGKKKHLLYSCWSTKDVSSCYGLPRYDEW